MPRGGNCRAGARTRQVVRRGRSARRPLAAILVYLRGQHYVHGLVRSREEREREETTESKGMEFRPTRSASEYRWLTPNDLSVLPGGKRECMGPRRTNTTKAGSGVPRMLKRCHVQWVRVITDSRRSLRTSQNKPFSDHADVAEPDFEPIRGGSQ